MTWLTAMEYLRHKWPQICSTWRKHLFRSFPLSWLLIGFVTRLTRRVPLVELELLTLPEHLDSLPVFSGVRVTRSLVLYVCFVDHFLSFCTFSFGHCVVCSSSIYGFWLLLWYLKNLLIKILPQEFFRVFMLLDLFVVQYVTLTLFCLSVMVSTVPAYLQNILIGTATRGNDQ
jgi:hypothetical protein